MARQAIIRKLDTSRDRQILENEIDRLWEAIDKGGNHISILPWALSSITKGTWAIAVNANQILNGSWTNGTGPADADQSNYRIFLDAGTYTMVLVTLKDSDHGILDVGIDTSWGTKDLYAAAPEYNHVWTVTGIVISTRGFKTIYTKANGKNASSSGYQVNMSTISLFKTA